MLQIYYQKVARLQYEIKHESTVITNHQSEILDYGVYEQQMCCRQVRSIMNSN